jgi:hypothetical protein
MGSQQNAVDLRRAGLVSGFYPGDVPRERRDELVQPINGHKERDAVTPTARDLATGLTRDEYSAAFGGSPVAVIEERSLAEPVESPSLAGTFPLVASGVMGEPSTAVKVDTSTGLEERQQALDELTEEQRTRVTAYEAETEKLLSADEIRAAFR